MKARAALGLLLVMFSASCVRREVWTGPDGRPVRGFEHFGADHCDWDRIHFITLDEVTYVQDTRLQFRDTTPVDYDPEAALPPDARSTGYERSGREVWTARSEWDAERRAYSSIYVVLAGKAERWPRFDNGCD